MNFPAQFLKLKVSKALPIFEKTQGFPDDFAGRVVAASLHFLMNQCFEFRRKVDVHGQGSPAFITRLSWIAIIVNVG